MNNPTFLALFSAVFILLGSYNIFNGLKRIREGRSRGISLKWYKQINLLTGIEYILLALVFIISTASRNGSLPQSLKGITFLLYLVLLLAAAILAGLVIRQGIINARTIRAQSRSSSSTTKSNGTRAIAEHAGHEEDPQLQAAKLERRRERRRNAAAARRRRAGKA
jgi:hypothetical protein